MKRMVRASFLQLAVAAGLFGQAASGTVTGTVTDQAGSVVPGASVTLVNEPTQLTRSVIRNEHGSFLEADFRGAILGNAPFPACSRACRFLVVRGLSTAITGPFQRA
jgi:hypothetical protein